MQADLARRRFAQVLVTALFAASVIVAGPAAPKAHAFPNPCNAPGGRYVCGKAAEGAALVLDNSVTGSITDAVDFATDPLGYLEQKIRSGTEGMFSSFGEALTGKKPSAPKDNKKDDGD